MCWGVQGGRGPEAVPAPAAWLPRADLERMASLGSLGALTWETVLTVLTHGLAWRGPNVSECSVKLSYYFVLDIPSPAACFLIL